MIDASCEGRNLELPLSLLINCFETKLDDRLSRIFLPQGKLRDEQKATKQTKDSVA